MTYKQICEADRTNMSQDLFKDHKWTLKEFLVFAVLMLLWALVTVLLIVVDKVFGK